MLIAPLTREESKGCNENLCKDVWKFSALLPQEGCCIQKYALSGAWSWWPAGRRGQGPGPGPAGGLENPACELQLFDALIFSKGIDMKPKGPARMKSRPEMAEMMNSRSEKAPHQAERDHTAPSLGGATQE